MNGFKFLMYVFHIFFVESMKKDYLEIVRKNHTSLKDFLELGWCNITPEKLF